VFFYIPTLKSIECDAKWSTEEPVEKSLAFLFVKHAKLRNKWRDIESNDKGKVKKVNGEETSKMHELALTRKIINSSSACPDPAERISSMLEKFMSHSTVILKVSWIILHGKKLVLN